MLEGFAARRRSCQNLWEVGKDAKKTHHGPPSASEPQPQALIPQPRMGRKIKAQGETEWNPGLPTSCEQTPKGGDRTSPEELAPPPPGGYSPFCFLPRGS